MNFWPGFCIPNWHRCVALCNVQAVVWLFQPMAGYYYFTAKALTPDCIFLPGMDGTYKSATQKDDAGCGAGGFIIIKTYKRAVSAAVCSELFALVAIFAKSCFYGGVLFWYHEN